MDLLWSSRVGLHCTLVTLVEWLGLVIGLPTFRPMTRHRTVGPRGLSWYNNGKSLRKPGQTYHVETISWKSGKGLESVWVALTLFFHIFNMAHSSASEDQGHGLLSLHQLLKMFDINLESLKTSSIIIFCKPQSQEVYPSFYILLKYVLYFLKFLKPDTPG